MKQAITALLVGGVMVAGAAVPARAFHEEAGRAVGEVVDQFRGLATQMGDHLRAHPLTIPGGPPPSPVERPLITFMLEHRAELGLGPEQVTRLEGLRSDFARESIRRDADIRIAELDLAALLEREPLDLPKVEAKIREVARLHADLRVERIRTIEQGRAVLTPEQRAKLQALLGGPTPRRTAEQRVRM
jgi:Spy/CpxP family protein refolding chaperone